MKQTVLLIVSMAITLLSYSQFYDTIRVGSGVTTLIEFKGDAEIRQLDISGSATASISQAKTKDLYYAVMDSTANIIKFKAIRPFSGKIILTVFSDTTVQYLVKFEQDPAKTYYSYDLSRFSTVAAKSKAVKAKPVKNNETAEESIPEGEEDLRSELEKNAGTILNPKNKLFTAIRSKNQNITVGDIRGGVRIYLQKLYKSKDLTYFQFKIANYSMGDFQLADFAINRVDGSSDVKLTMIHEESAFNLLKRYEKVDFIAIGEKVEVSSTGKLVFSFKGDKGKAFTFEIDSKLFEKREPL